MNDLLSPFRKHLPKPKKKAPLTRSQVWLNLLLDMKPEQLEEWAKKNYGITKVHSSARLLSYIMCQKTQPGSGNIYWQSYGKHWTMSAPGGRTPEDIDIAFPTAIVVLIELIEVLLDESDGIPLPAGFDPGNIRRVFHVKTVT